LGRRREGMYKLLKKKGFVRRVRKFVKFGGS
jgi:hypothetical protein